jgi:hypothetical protein
MRIQSSMSKRVMPVIPSPTACFVLRSSLKKCHSTRDKVMLIMDYLDNMEEEYHKVYPDDPCPMEGGYKASFERFVIESIGAE